MKPCQPTEKAYPEFSVNAIFAKQMTHFIFTDNQLDNMVKETSCSELQDARLGGNSTVKSCLCETIYLLWLNKAMSWLNVHTFNKSHNAWG